MTFFEYLLNFRLFPNAHVIADTGDFAQHIQRSAFAGQSEIEPGSDRRRIKPKGETFRGAAKVGVERGNSGDETKNVLRRSTVAYIEVVGNVGRTVRDHRKAANDDELNLVRD
ncbi:MAG: hypothetical protein ACLP9L_33270 [Thermoguttaceae bacterium]